jgi:hypothetical protein
VTTDERVADLEKGFRELLNAVHYSTLPDSHLEKTLRGIARWYLKPPTPTIESVYGISQSNPPKGWRFDGFRCPLNGEAFLGRVMGEVAYCNTDCSSEPRLILVKCKRLVFEIIREDRAPRVGQLFSCGETVGRAMDGGYCETKYILSEPRVEE